MRVLVTGGHGFIGSHVLRQLDDGGHTVGCFDLSEPSPVAEPVADAVEYYAGDVTDPVNVYDAVADFEPDRIVHLASLLGRSSQADPRAAFDVNVHGTIHVFEAADALDVERVVAASSVAAYGSVPEEVETLDETVVQRPRNIYGLTKYAAERIGETYRDQYGVEFAAIQPVHGIGPDRRRGNVEDALVVKAAVSWTPLTVPNLGAPYEPIYVGDEATAFVDAVLADSLPHDEYVIGTGDLVTLPEVIEIVRRHVPDAEFTLSEQSGDGEFEVLPPTDTSRIETDLGWHATYDVEAAVAEYVDWLRDNRDQWSFEQSAVPWSLDE